MVSPTDPIHTLNTLVWNTRGILSSTYELSCLLDQYSVDLAPICEHKLFSLGLIHKKLHTYMFVENYSINPYSLATCCNGGLALLTKKTLPCYVFHIDTGGSERILVWYRRETKGIAGYKKIKDGR